MLCVMVLGAMAVETLYEGPAHDTTFYILLAGIARSRSASDMEPPRGSSVDVWGPPKPNSG
jgi:hypothetical protein